MLSKYQSPSQPNLLRYELLQSISTIGSTKNKQSNMRRAHTNNLNIDDLISQFKTRKVSKHAQRCSEILKIFDQRTQQLKTKRQLPLEQMVDVIEQKIKIKMRTDESFESFEANRYSFQPKIDIHKIIKETSPIKMGGHKEVKYENFKTFNEIVEEYPPNIFLAHFGGSSPVVNTPRISINISPQELNSQCSQGNIQPNNCQPTKIENQLCKIELIFKSIDSRVNALNLSQLRECFIQLNLFRKQQNRQTAMASIVNKLNRKLGVYFTLLRKFRKEQVKTTGIIVKRKSSYVDGKENSSKIVSFNLNQKENNIKESNQVVEPLKMTSKPTINFEEYLRRQSQNMQ